MSLQRRPAQPPRVPFAIFAPHGRTTRRHSRVSQARIRQRHPAHGRGRIGVLAANSPLASIYDSLWQVPLALSVGSFALAKPLLLWINDGLMAVFFLLVGLELKREILEGELSDRSQIVLPVAGAIGGMLVPALIYTACNLGNTPRCAAGRFHPQPISHSRSASWPCSVRACHCR